MSKFPKVVFILFQLSFFIHLSKQEKLLTNSKIDNLSVAQEIKEKYVKESLTENLIPFLLKKLVEIQDATNVPSIRQLFGPDASQQCIDHWTQLTEEIKSLLELQRVPDTWAIQMVDSWGKFPSGILSGHTSVIGDFLECIQIRGNYSNVSEQTSLFKGRYCYTAVTPNMTTLNNSKIDVQSTVSSKFLTIQDTFSKQGLRESASPEEFFNLLQDPYGVQLIPFMGTCFPSSCSSEDAQQFFQNLYSFLTNSTVSQTIVQCYTDDKEAFDAGDITVIVVLSIIGILCIVGAAIDILIYRKADSDSSIRKGLGMQVIVAFSLYTNINKWLSIQTGKDNLGCLHGLRFLSMCWVVLGHTWSMMQFQSTWNLVDIKMMYNSNLPMYAILNGFVSVDTFFTISGTLVAYHMLRELQKNKGKLNIPMMILHRYLRLTPTYIILVGILATLIPYLGSSPTWYMIEYESKSCEKNWWHDVLYINNFVKYNQESNMCYGESWYLANDMQFFILSPFIIYPLYRWKRIGLALLAVLSIMSIAAPAIITGVKDLPPVPILFRDVKTIYQDVYMKPWTRIGPYLVGIFLGYILNAQSNSRSANKPTFRMSKWLIYLCWILSTGTALAIIFGIKSYFNPNYDNTKTNLIEAGGIAYAGLHRYVWGIVISWIIYACVNGYGGFVNDFLSWKPFIPLGRLTFCVYICSYYIQLIFHSTTLTTLHYSPYIYVNLFFAHLVMSLLVGFVLTVTLESPFIQLEKILFKPVEKKSERVPEIPETNNVTIKIDK